MNKNGSLPTQQISVTPQTTTKSKRKKKKNNNSDVNKTFHSFLAQPIVELQLAVLVLMSCLLVGLGTLDNIPQSLEIITKYGELTNLAIFTVEYIVRCKLQGFSAKYILHPWALIDGIAILPGIIKLLAIMTGGDLFVPMVSGGLINLRLLRILRLQRVLKDYKTFKKFQSAVGFNLGPGAGSSSVISVDQEDDININSTKPYQL